MSRILFLVLLAGFYGCASSTPMQVIDHSQYPREKYPPISVFWMEPSDELKAECTRYDQASMLQSCKFNDFNTSSMSDALRDTHLFESVRLADKQNDYAVVVNTVTFHKGDGGDLAKAVVVGASLGLLPVTTRMTVKSDVALFWRGLLIKKNSYELPYVVTESLLNKDDSDRQFAESLISNFIKDARNDDIFSGRFLATALQASDYEKDLGLPEQIGTHFYENRLIYRDPFLGVMIRYRHLTNMNNFNDIFIYPIRATDWSDEAKILANEATNIRKEIELLEQEDYIRELQFRDNILVDVPVGDTTRKGLMFSSLWVNEEEELTTSYIYLFLSGDKYIKVRGSMPNAGEAYNIEDFVRQAIASIQVPAEDTFMAGIREEQRQKPSQAH